jgi:putative membrane protein
MLQSVIRFNIAGIFLKKIVHIKYKKDMKTTTTFIIAAILSISACKNENTNSNDPKDIAEEHNEAKFDKAKEKDAQFLVDAAELDLMEIKLGELAQNQAVNDSVKELGKILLKDHQKSLKELQVLAGKKMVTIPSEITEKGRDSYNKLLEKKAAEFDEFYCDEMVKGHKDAIDKFEKGATDAEDVEIKNWANKQLPVLRTHLDKAMNYRDNLKGNSSEKMDDNNNGKNKKRSTTIKEK